MLVWVLCLLAIVPVNEEYTNARFERSMQVPENLVAQLKLKDYELEGNTFDWYYYHLKMVEEKENMHIMASDFGHIMLEQNPGQNREDKYYSDDWNGLVFPLIIPIHFGKAGKSAGHWVTAVIDKFEDKMTMHYFDFYRSKLPQHVVENIEDYLNYKFEIEPIVPKQSKNWFASLFSKSEEVENPILSEIQVFRHQYQFDGYSCGVFSLFVMELYSSKVNQHSLGRIFDSLSHFKQNDIHEKRQQFADLLEVDIYNQVVVI